MSEMRRVTVLVCGEPLRGDDAVAEALVRALPAATLRLGEICHVGGLMPDDLLAAGSPVIVVDAVRGLPAGTVVDLPLEGVAELAAMGVTSASTHALPMPTVLGLVRQLAGRLPEGRFIGVAGGDFGLGDPLSDEVREAVEPCAARLGHWVRALAHDGRSGACA
jgi:hydrogenase maturation protease